MVLALPQHVAVFTDDAARAWEVREIRQPILEDPHLRFLPPEFAQGWLLFTSDGERRRLAPLPPGWQLAGDDLMRRWCRDASPVLSTR
jgi:hypothetical protein